MFETKSQSQLFHRREVTRRNIVDSGVGNTVVDGKDRQAGKRGVNHLFYSLPLPFPFAFTDPFPPLVLVVTLPSLSFVLFWPLIGLR